MTTSTKSPGTAVPDRLAADLAAAARLRSIDALRDGLEHELRSPLNAVVLNVELLKELVRAEGGASAVVQLERLDTISKALTRLQHGLADLFQFTREPDERASRFELADLVGGIRSRVIGQFKQRRLSLETDLPTGLAVRGRREALAQALIQLLIRALDVSPSGASVGLSARRADGRVVLEVRDAGPAVDPELRQRLFDPDASPTSALLHVAKKLIEAEGGELELASSAADGSVIRAHFPEVHP